MWHDGRLLIGIGVFLLGAVLAETIRWLAVADGRVLAFPWLAGAGFGLVLAGLSQRRRANRQARTAVTVGAWDPSGPAGGKDRIKRAVTYSQQNHELTLAVEAELTGGVADLPIAEQVVTCASGAIGLADRFKADTEQINLFPVMRLHVGFWFGAQLGGNHATPIGVWQPTRDDGGYYLAVVLSQPGPPPRTRRRVDPPFMSNIESFTDGPAVRVALAVVVRHRDAASEERIRAKCRDTGIDQVLWLRSKSDWLPPDTETFTAALDQVEREWRDRLPAAAASYAAFLETTIALAVGIGARLAGTDPPDRWVAYTKDRTGAGGLVRFPPEGVGGS
jgi:hypothetical protein